jgi:hypothetical protein
MGASGLNLGQTHDRSTTRLHRERASGDDVTLDFNAHIRRGFILVFAALGKRRPEVRTQRERRHAQLRGGLLDREVLVESGDPGVTVEGHGWRNVSLAFRPSCPTVSLPVYQPERDGISVSSPDIDRVDLFKRTAPKGRFSSALKIIRKPDGQPRPACFHRDRADRRGMPRSDARPAGPRSMCRHWRRRPCARLRPVWDRQC